MYTHTHMYVCMYRYRYRYRYIDPREGVDGGDTEFG